MKLSLRIFMLLIIVSQGHAQLTWYYQHPLPQGNSLYDIQFINPTTAIAVGDVATVLRTTDRGNTWVSRLCGTPYPLSAVSFADFFTGTAVGVFGTIYRTIDGGLTWKPQSTNFSGFIEDVDMTDTNTGTAVGNRGTILRTTNGGKLWIEQTSNTTSWLYGVDFVTNKIGTVVGESGTILHTTDGGTTWLPQTNGTWNDLLAVFFINADTGTAVGRSGTVIRTTDGGSTWFSQSCAAIFDLSEVTFIDADTGFVGGFGCFYRTTDGGTTWKTVTHFPPFIDGFDFINADVGITVGTGGEMYRTSDGGGFWTDIGLKITGNELVGVFFPTTDVGYAVGANETIVKTSNGGLRWTLISSGTTHDLLGVYFSSIDSGMVVGVNGRIRRTTDGGSKWVTSPSGTSNNLWGIFSTNATTAFAVGNGGTILKTIDGGMTWVPLPSGTTNDLHSVNFVNEKTGIAVGELGIILRTTDGGENWSPRTSGTLSRLWSVSFGDQSTGTAVGSEGTILRTKDGGLTWVSQSSGTGIDLNGVSFTNKNFGVAVGGNFGVPGIVLRTTNGGTTWSEPQNITTNPVNAVFFTDEMNGTAVGVAGMIISTRPGGTVQFPNADFVANKTTAYTNEEIQFTNQSTGEIHSYRWDFGDNRSSTIENPTHAYNAPGKYSVSLTVTGPNSSDKKKKTDYITVLQIPQVFAVFSPSEIQGIAPFEVEFTNESTGLIDSCRWNFGDGHTSTEENPSFIYRDPGHYTVQLIVYGEMDIDSTYGKVNVFIAEPVIVSITDVENDQGGKVLVDWERSGYDGTVDSIITVYSVWEQLEKSWVEIGSVKACKDLHYTYLANTLNDSCPDGINFSYFRIKAHTADPSIFYFSPADSGYSVDNISPEAPVNLQAVANPGAIYLEWEESEAEDFGHFLVFRDDSTIDQTVESNFTDTKVVAGEFYIYKVQAVDLHGNHSEFSDPVKVYFGSSGINIYSGIPKEYRLMQNYPNPFNAQTYIRFGLPKASRVHLVITNLLGQIIYTLKDEDMKAGYHLLSFDASKLSSGIYFYQLDVENNFVETKKMLLLR
ncbi:PKD domain-containing protein [candidate division KSB1 bacterium]|nr:PKD domain-containing protein [candidate division KSB1 bacterium]